MANFVINKVHIGAEDEQMQNILKAIQRDGDVLGSFDFNKLIPMPAALSVVDGSVTDVAISAYIHQLRKTDGAQASVDLVNAGLAALEIRKRSILSRIDFHISDEAVDEVAKFFDMSVEELCDLGRQYIENQEKYGAHTWYRWCSENWGTKWNAQDGSVVSKDDPQCLIFDTANSSPRPIIRALSEKFPEILFTIEWSDEDMGYNVGAQTYYSGKIIMETIPEPGSREAYEMAFEIHGTSPEEHFLRYDEKTGTYEFDEDLEARAYETSSLDDMIASAQSRSEAGKDQTDKSKEKEAER